MKDVLLEWSGVWVACSFHACQRLCHWAQLSSNTTVAEAALFATHLHSCVLGRQFLEFYSTAFSKNSEVELCKCNGKQCAYSLFLHQFGTLYWNYGGIGIV
jgi:hypothetical protein